MLSATTCVRLTCLTLITAGFFAVCLFIANSSHSADSSGIGRSTYTTKTQQLIIETSTNNGIVERGNIVVSSTKYPWQQSTGSEGNINMVCPDGTMMTAYVSKNHGYIQDPTSYLAWDQATPSKGREIRYLDATTNWKYIPTCLNVDTTWTGNCTNTLWTANYFRPDDMSIRCSPALKYEWR